MEKLRLDLDRLKVESFQADGARHGAGTVKAFDGSCSNAPTCGIASRGEETYQQEIFTLYACCV
jgi:hypothetical protein